MLVQKQLLGVGDDGDVDVSCFEVQPRQKVVLLSTSCSSSCCCVAEPWHVHGQQRSRSWSGPSCQRDAWRVGRAAKRLWWMMMMMMVCQACTQHDHPQGRPQWRWCQHRCALEPSQHRSLQRKRGAERGEEVAKSASVSVGGRCFKDFFSGGSEGKIGGFANARTGGVLVNRRVVGAVATQGCGGNVLDGHAKSEADLEPLRMGLALFGAIACDHCRWQKQVLSALVLPQPKHVVSKATTAAVVAHGDIAAVQVALLAIVSTAKTRGRHDGGDKGGLDKWKAW